MDYGAIGSVIGHEISHSFDDPGAHFDAEGRLKTGGRRRTSRTSRRRPQALIRQYDAYRPFPDLAVNGKLTLSENIADVAGLAAAYDAYRSRTAASKRRVAGVTGDQQFFLSFAQFWRRRSARRAAPADHDRRPRAGGVSRRHRAQPRCLVRRLRREAGPEALPGAEGSREGLVRPGLGAYRTDRGTAPARADASPTRGRPRATGTEPAQAAPRYQPARRRHHRSTTKACPKGRLSCSMTSSAALRRAADTATPVPAQNCHPCIVAPGTSQHCWGETTTRRSQYRKPRRDQEVQRRERLGFLDSPEPHGAAERNRRRPAARKHTCAAKRSTGLKLDPARAAEAEADGAPGPGSRARGWP